MTYVKSVWRIQELPQAPILKQISEWERIAYGEGKFRTPEQLQEWVDRNPANFLCAMEGKTLLAYSDLWSLERDVYSQLRSGMLLEEEVPPAALQKDNELTPYLYIGSIITNPLLRKTHPSVTSKAFRETCNGVADVLTKIAVTTKFPLEILSVGSSLVGVKLLTKFKFRLFEMAKEPLDVRQRYIKQLSSPLDINDFRF